MISAKKLRQNTKKLDILFVEDDETLRSSMGNIFTELFKSVDLAEDGKIGLQKYKERLQKGQESYDLVITDISMPHLNGIEMIKAIYKIKPQQSVVVVSAHNESEYLMELLHIGVNNFLIKPVQHNALISTLFKTTQVIINELLIQDHYTKIEQLNEELFSQSEALRKSNDALIEKNIALEKSMRIIEGMYHKDQLQCSMGLAPKSLKGMGSEPEMQSQDEPFPDTACCLDKIEEIISDIALQYRYKEIKNDLLKALSREINAYADSLPEKNTLHACKEAFKKLSVAVSVHPKYSSPDQLERVYSMLESFFFIYSKLHRVSANTNEEEFETLSRSIPDEINILVDVWQSKL